MHYHAKAALTASQRTLIQQLHREGLSKSALARRFQVDLRTIQRWVNRSDVTDRSSAPHQHGKQVVTHAYREAVIAERTTHPNYGPKRIAQALRANFPTANVATVWRILKAAGLSSRAPKKTQAPTHPSRSSSGADRHSGTASD